MRDCRGDGSGAATPNRAVMHERIVVVDDHAGFRGWARDMLKAEGFDVAGEAADGASALKEIDRVAPDVVLLDIRLPDIDGFEVARRIESLPSSPAVVLTSSRDSDQYRERLRRSAVCGFVPKHLLSGTSIRGLIEGTP